MFLCPGCKRFEVHKSGRLCSPCNKKRNARPEARAARRAYNKSEKGRNAQRRYAKKPKSRRLHLEVEFRGRYGIDYWDWALLYEKQKGLCAGCERTLLFGRSTHVDHCHGRGVVRGLLCRECNIALGNLHDSPETLRRLAAYVEAR